MEPGLLLFSLLTQAAPVTALLGYVDKQLGPQHRLYPLRAPEGTPLPYVVYQVVSGTADATMTCDLADEARVQLSLFAASYAQVCELHAACRAALHGQRVGTVTIDFDGFQETHDDRALCYLRTQDYLLEGL